MFQEEEKAPDTEDVVEPEESKDDEPAPKSKGSDEEVPDTKPEKVVEPVVNPYAGAHIDIDQLEGGNREQLDSDEDEWQQQPEE